MSADTASQQTCHDTRPLRRVMVLTETDAVDQRFRIWLHFRRSNKMVMQTRLPDAMLSTKNDKPAP